MFFLGDFGDLAVKESACDRADDANHAAWAVAVWDDPEDPLPLSAMVIPVRAAMILVSGLGLPTPSTIPNLVMTILTQSAQF
jgi:hypothetical protein